MKNLIIFLLLINPVALLAQQQQKVFKFWAQSVEKQESKQLDVKSGWTKMPPQEPFLVVLDFDKSNISTYGSIPMKLSIVKTKIDDQRSVGQYVLTGMQCIDASNEPVHAAMVTYYDNSKVKKEEMILDFNTIKFRFTLTRD